MKRWWLPALGGAALLAAPALAPALRPGPASTPGGRWVRAGPRPIPRTLVELGEVVSERVTTVHAQTGGEVVWLIPEGTAVNPGDVVARFNAEDYEEAVANQEREVEAMRHALAREEEALATARREQALATRKAELEVEAAKMALRQLLEEAAEAEIRRAEVRLERALFEWREAERQLARVRRLRRGGVATLQEVLTAEENLRTREVEKEKAAETLKALKEGPDPRLVAEAKLRIRQAERALARQRDVERETLALYESRVKIARANLERAEALLRYSRAEYEGCTVRAPVAGRVVYHRIWKGDENRSRVEVGETVNRMSELLKIADLEHLRVRFPVNEADVGRLKGGEEARVRILAIPGRTFRGRLVRIGRVAWDKNKRLGELALMHAGEAGVSVVTCEVALQERDPRIRLGSTARVELVLAPLRGEVVIPAAAVRRTAAGYVVRTRGGERPVRLGPGWGDWVCVTGGLGAGEEVYVGP